MYTLPLGCIAIPCGDLMFELVANIPVVGIPAIPIPAIILIIPVVLSIFSIR
jgi:hypothetical protein